MVFSFRSILLYWPLSSGVIVTVLPWASIAPLSCSAGAIACGNEYGAAVYLSPVVAPRSFMTVSRSEPVPAKTSPFTTTPLFKTTLSFEVLWVPMSISISSSNGSMELYPSTIVSDFNIKVCFVRIALSNGPCSPMVAYTIFLALPDWPIDLMI